MPLFSLKIHEYELFGPHFRALVDGIEPQCDPVYLAHDVLNVSANGLNSDCDNCIEGIFILLPKNGKQVMMDDVKRNSLFYAVCSCQQQAH